MAILKGELQASNGDVLYPYTSSDVVFGADGKSIQEQMNVLSVDRGYLKANTIRNTDLNTVTKQGMYTFNSYSTIGNSNTPTPGLDITYQLSVIGESDETFVQIATQSYPRDNARMFYRNCSVGQMGVWRQVATTNGSLCTIDASTFGTDLNNAVSNGMYHVINMLSLTNRPPTTENVGNLIVMGGTSDASLSKVQYFIPFNCSGIYIRTRGYGLAEWQPWKEIVTTTKEPFLVTPLTGISILWQNNYKQGNLYFINLEVSYASGTIPTGANTQIGTLPITTRRCPLAFGGIINGTTCISGVSMVTDIRLFISPSANTTGAIISGVVFL